MNLHEADSVLRKLDGIWVLRTEHTDTERNEWLDFLLALDHGATLEAVNYLRGQLKWRPSMAELRSAYREAIEDRDEQPIGLPGKVDPAAPTMADLYGSSQAQWVFCWRCDTAISLADQCDGPVFAGRLGLRHRRCPKPGTSPHMPEYLRTEREDYWVKHHVRKPS